MEEFKEALKKAGKVIWKSLKTILFPFAIIFCIVLILFSSFVYFITIDDGTYKEDDWSSTPYAASEFVNNTTINEDGTINNSISAEDLWNKMLENDSRVDEYLDSSEELARLMKAEMVTQYPDTRPNPDEPIDWDSVIKGDTTQGIIKFKRADTDGNKSTMTYVDPSTFQGYIDEYNSTGSESAKQAALSHFTLKRSSGTTGSSGGVNYNGPDLCWPTTSTNITSNFGPRGAPTAGASTNHQGIDIAVPSNSEVYACEDGVVKTAAFDDSAGNYVEVDHGNGYVSRYLHNNSFNVSVGDEVKKGDVVAFSGSTGTSTGPHCHFEIRFNGKAIDPLSFKYNNGMGNGSGGFGEDDEEDEAEDKDEENEDKEKEDDEKEDVPATSLAQETSVSGDGYDSEYTSSAGITYKQFKQYKGSYAGNGYWGGTIETHGCGPTSIAILASGLTDLEYTPANTASEMNEKYGYTNAENLKGEMDSLGLTSEITYNPSAEQIQDNLRNGKVMLVSVDSRTIFTGGSHLMTLIDINDQGQVYISNPSDYNGTKNGWFDVSEIMKGCNYIVTTDAHATGIAQSNNTSNYVAVVATWRQVDTTVTTNDPNVEPVDTTTYTMTTTDVNYEVMVEPYTMPFDFLWALLVVGESKHFVFDIADLVYNSDIEITVHDNLTINTDVDEWNYTLRTKAEVGDATITANCGGITETGTVAAHTHDPWGDDQNYITTKTVVTQTNTLNIAVTRANVWIVDYQNEFTYNAPTSNTTNDQVTQPDTEYESSGTADGSSFTCSEIDSEKSSLGSSVRQKYISSHSSSSNSTNGTNSTTSSVTAPPVSYDVDVSVEYFTKYINIVDNVTNTTETQKYVSGTPTLKEKTDPDSKEPNFVTIFNESKYSKNKSNIKSAAEWLFEILETNDSTKDTFVDLMKYLLYKATGVNYGVTEFDFSIFYPGSLTSVGANDYIVNIDMSSQDIVITDLETLKTAFSGYSGSSELIAHAQEFLDFQEEYRVNAVFAAAVSISETSAGRAGHAVNGKNNWFNIECTCGNSSHGRFETYSSASESIERFYWQISQGGYYFTEGNYTVRSIGMIYCEDADAPGGWIDNTLTFMTQMFQAAGIDVSSFSANGDFVEVAKQCHDYLVQNNYYYSSAANKSAGRYVYDAESTGSSIPKPYPGEGNYIDCSAYVTWVLYEYGYKDLGPGQESTRTLLGLAQRKGWTVKDGSQAQAGDIVLIPGYHTAIYAGNGQFYDCGSTNLIRSPTTTWNPGYDYAITVTKP